MGKCQYECIVYKVEVHRRGPNSSIAGNNDKKGICRFYTRTVKKRYYNHRSSLCTKYIGIDLVYLCVGN